ncbi:hypothetical protein Q6272_32865, partial [Klebsiella pneumoniae]|nr:hypothetical protein [Klebsiella pneumoniae]
MNSLRSMSISRRLWLILIVAVLMLLALGLLMLKQIHGDLYQAKRQQTQHVVQTASGRRYSASDPRGRQVPGNAH